MSSTRKPATTDLNLAYLMSLPVCGSAPNRWMPQPFVNDHILDGRDELAARIFDAFPGVTEDAADAIVGVAVRAFVNRLTAEEAYRLGTDRAAVDAMNDAFVQARARFEKAG